MQFGVDSIEVKRSLKTAISPIDYRFDCTNASTGWQMVG